MRLLVTDAAAQPPRQATAWLIITLAKMKYLSLLILALWPMGGFADPDPFSMQNSSWAIEMRQAKPYVLEIAYGDAPASIWKDGKIDGLEHFLNKADYIRIATATSDSGSYESTRLGRILFKIDQPDEAHFSLKIDCSLLVGGQRGLTSDITLLENSWIMMGGLTRETDSGKANYIVALRIRKEANQTPEPTPTAVTPDADASVAPSAGAAHL